MSNSMAETARDVNRDKLQNLRPRSRTKDSHAVLQYTSRPRSNIPGDGLHQLTCRRTKTAVVSQKLPFWFWLIWTNEEKSRRFCTDRGMAAHLTSSTLSQQRLNQIKLAYKSTASARLWSVNLCYILHVLLLNATDILLSGILLHLCHRIWINPVV